jgi:excisionase family DNA binding protein
MKKGIFIQSIEAEELQELIRQAIRVELTNVNSEEKDVLLSRSKAAEALGVSFPTLRRYVVSGKLRQRKIGGKVYFSTSDISAALK